MEEKPRTATPAVRATRSEAETLSMKAGYSERAGRTLDGLTPQLRKAVYKQVKLLEQNLRHPSLRAKKYDESRNIWQARVNKDWRFYFLIRDDVYYIIDIIPHPK